MSDYQSTATVEQIAQRIGAARRILLTTHVKPDGDGFGSVLALARVVRALGGGATADIYLMGPLELRLREIAGDTPYTLAEGEPPAGECGPGTSPVALPRQMDRRLEGCRFARRISGGGCPVRARANSIHQAPASGQLGHD